MQKHRILLGLMGTEVVRYSGFAQSLQVFTEQCLLITNVSLVTLVKKKNKLTLSFNKLTLSFNY